MLIAIDGTSIYWDDAKYRQQMQGSFIHQLDATTCERNHRWFRGPTISGIQDRWIANEALNLIRDWRLRLGDRRVVLAGYSRGGAVAIYVARQLERETWARGLKVACLALFDAVDRDPLIDAREIPGNVEYAYHAMRDPAVGSRWYFSNCGQTICQPGKLEPRKFFGTHAALGGLPFSGDHPSYEAPHSRTELPYTVVASAPMAAPGMSDEAPRLVPITRAQDQAAAAQVRDWMWGHLRRHGVVA